MVGHGCATTDGWRAGIAEEETEVASGTLDPERAVMARPYPESLLHVTWSAVKRLMLQQGPQIEPECAEAVKAVITDGSARQAEVGFPLAASLLDIYRYRYQSIEAFRVSRPGWPGFFLALKTAAGRVGLVTIRCSDWRFIVLTDENLQAALACLYRPPSP